MSPPLHSCFNNIDSGYFTRDRFIRNIIFSMAPAVTETVSLRAPTFSVPLKSDAGHNKENLIGYKYEKEAELKGTDKLPPASYPDYLPVWDNETERCVHKLHLLKYHN